jgi:hypothetical protein
MEDAADINGMKNSEITVDEELVALNYLVKNGIKASVAKNIMSNIVLFSKNPSGILIKSFNKSPINVVDIKFRDLSDLITFIKKSKLDVGIINYKEES